MQKLAGNFVPSTTPCRVPQGGGGKAIRLVNLGCQSIAQQSAETEKDAAQIPTRTGLWGGKVELLLAPRPGVEAERLLISDPANVCAIRGIEDPGRVGGTAAQAIQSCTQIDFFKPWHEACFFFFFFFFF